MRNYEMIHLIQEAGLPKDAQNVVERAFNKMNEIKDHNGCLTTSVALCTALEYLGYSPKLCIGKFWSSDYDFYHAWTELDGKVIDIAIYGNTSWSPYWLDGVINPQVYKDYAKTDVKYEPFSFDDEFENADISKTMGKSFYYYCDHAPKRNSIWNLILYYLNTSSVSTLSAIKEISKKHIIGER